jgi:hypothetical protein
MLLGYLTLWHGKTRPTKSKEFLIDSQFLPSVHRKYSPDLRIHGWTIGETNDERRPDATEPEKKTKQT